MKNYKKIDEFTPIAMKCNEEQFYEIKPILEKFNLWGAYSPNKWSREYCYLVNKRCTKDLTGCNLYTIINDISNCHTEWKAETFLKACGIVEDNPNIDLSKLTPELITELCKDEKIKEILINNGVVKNELELNRWYKSKKLNDVFIRLEDNDKGRYGFDSCGWYKTNDSNKGISTEYWQLATPQEVETALKNEAVKRGFVKGALCNNSNIHNSKTNNNKIDFDYMEFIDNELRLYKNNDSNCYYQIFNNGVWAEIIKEETYIKIPLSIITLTDSDKKLGALVKSIAENY
jgi:hypothetical protein